MKQSFKNLKIVYRKLKISDFEEFNELFYECFKRKVSFDFYRWRYFNGDLSFCHGAFISTKLIANVGMISKELRNKQRERVFSRHSSMVLNKYRGIGIFSKLLRVVKNKIEKNVGYIVMWPNKKNFSNFDIDVKSILNKKFYIYKTTSSKNFKEKTTNLKIEKLKKIKNSIKKSSSFFFKDFINLKKRYLLYKKNDYYINKFQLNNQKSFFILQYNKEKSLLNNVILDHFGSKKLKNKHLFYLIQNLNNLIFLSKKKIYKDKYKLINSINFKIGFIKKINLKKKRDFLKNKDIFLGDTDIFIKIE